MDFGPALLMGLCALYVATGTLVCVTLFIKLDAVISACKKD